MSDLDFYFSLTIYSYVVRFIECKMLANSNAQACKIQFKQVGTARIIINCEQFYFELPTKQKG